LLYQTQQVSSFQKAQQQNPIQPHHASRNLQIINMQLTNILTILALTIAGAVAAPGGAHAPAPPPKPSPPSLNNQVVRYPREVLYSPYCLSDSLLPFLS